MIFPHFSKRLAIVTIVGCVVSAFIVTMFFRTDVSNESWRVPFQSATAQRPTVFVLLLDTADPRLVEKFSAMGELPNFARLRERGVSGDLESFSVNHFGRQYTLSLPIIASIFTGRSSEEHGMESHIFLANGPGDYYPFSGLKTKPIWKILSEHARSVGIVGTMGNFPVERGLNGYVVSGEYIIKQMALSRLSLWTQVFARVIYRDDTLIFPVSILPEIRHGFLSEVAVQEKFAQYPFTTDFPDAMERVVHGIWQWILSEKEGQQRALRFAVAFNEAPDSAYLTFEHDAQVMAVARHLYQQSRPDLFVEYHQGLDFYSMMYHTEETLALSPEENALLGYYRFFDERIGQILEEIDEHTTLMVISDHGVSDAESAEDFRTLRTLHKPIGIFYLLGKNVPENTRVGGLTVFDITPTILYLLGLPTARDMRGQVPSNVIRPEFLETRPEVFIPTYEDSLLKM